MYASMCHWLNIFCSAVGRLSRLQTAEKAKLLCGCGLFLAVINVKMSVTLESGFNVAASCRQDGNLLVFGSSAGREHC